MRALVLAGICLIIPFTGIQADDRLQDSIRLQAEVGREAAQSQEKVNQLHDETQRLLAEHRSLSGELKSLQQYNDHLQKMVSEQEKQLSSLRQQMGEINVTHREVIPLMARMVATLEQFIELDMPFLLDERRQRTAELNKLLDQPDVSVAEKYRRVMEAYQVEVEYGRSMEVYAGSLQQGDREKTVEFLRVGRLGLIYRSLEGREIGFWNPSTQSWRTQAEDYQRSIALGYRMARKQVTPDFLKLPVPAPETLQ